MHADYHTDAGMPDACALCYAVHAVLTSHACALQVATARALATAELVRGWGRVTADYNTEFEMLSPNLISLSPQPPASARRAHGGGDGGGFGSMTTYHLTRANA